MKLAHPRPWILSLLLVVVSVLVLAGCKTSVEAQKNRALKARDRLDAVAAKYPAMRDAIQLKLAEFDRDLKAAEAKGGDAAIKAIAAVASRMEAYETQINPQQPTPAGTTTTTPGGKLGPAGTAPPPLPPVTTTPPVVPPAGGSGFGGSTGTVTPPPAVPPAGGSGFGGGAPAPTPTPTPAPTPAPGGSGFGGQ